MESGREKFKKNKKIIFFLVKLNNIFPDSFNNFLLIFFKNLPGKLGILFRFVLVKNLAKSCGDNVVIHGGVYLKGLKNISIGNNISIHSMCYIDGSGGIDLKNDISIAHGSTIMSTNHTWDDKNVPIKYNKITSALVRIENDVWIGCGCRVLSGVTIKQRTIIAAGAVVNRDVDPNSIYGGVPAKFIKKI